MRARPQRTVNHTGDGWPVDQHAAIASGSTEAIRERSHWLNERLCRRTAQSASQLSRSLRHTSIAHNFAVSCQHVRGAAAKPSWLRPVNSSFAHVDCSLRQMAVTAAVAVPRP